MNLEKHVLVIYDDGNCSTTIKDFLTQEEAHKAMIEDAKSKLKEEFYELIEDFYEDGGYISWDNSITGDKFEYSIHTVKFELDTNEPAPDDSILICWTIEDVYQLVSEYAEYLESDITFTAEQAAKILTEALENHDANLGITWDTLRALVENEFREMIQEEKNETQNLSEIAKSIITDLDLSGRANGVNDGEMSLEEVTKTIRTHIHSTGLRYQGIEMMRSYESEVMAWFKDQLF